MKILITGASGQLGKELMGCVPTNHQAVGLDRKGLDISDLDRVLEQVKRVSPDVIVNAGAYTAVDRAETEPEKAFAVNAQGAANLAQAAAMNNIRLIQVSTDFVFDGSQSRPYGPNVQPCPLSVYGESKWEGERRIVATDDLSYVIVRTSWVYSVHGNNFVKTILRLLKERQQLAVVGDQIGSPTWAGGLASGIWAIIGQESLSGVVHWSDEGVASWYDFAVAIQEEALNLGLVARAIPIKAIPADQYPLLARRPHFSVLDKSDTWKSLGFSGEHWRGSLRRMLLEIKGLENE